LGFQKNKGMISFIKGIVSEKHPTHVVVETGGIGYHINISLYTYARIESLEQVKLLTHLYIKEDSHTLFGFAEELERRLFRHLISVSGIGPSTAQIMLSSLQPEDIRMAILQENLDQFQRIKGIGKKTAQRIILDLKDKLTREPDEVIPELRGSDNTKKEEALSALIALGFNRLQAQKVLQKVIQDQPELVKVEDLIKVALRYL
jgi:holliday junction DNA helicase RuvA